MRMRQEKELEVIGASNSHNINVFILYDRNRGMQSIGLLVEKIKHIQFSSAVHWSDLRIYFMNKAY